jgi:integrase
MASFYKRGDYQWEAKVRRAGFPSQSQTFESKSEARNWAHKLESEMRLGTFVAPTQANQRPLSEFVDLYVKDVTPSHKGAGVEALRLKALARHRFFETAVCNLRPKTIAAWRDERLADVMPATVVRELGLLQQVVDHAMREWDVVIANNPFKLVKRPKVANARSRRLTLADVKSDPMAQSEEARLLKACTYSPKVPGGCRVKWLRPIVELAIETAMRRGEILRLDWRHIDLDARVAFLPDTKNGDSRHVPLSPGAINVFKSLVKTEGPVFNVSENALKLAWQRATKRADLDDLHFHDLRHEGASRLAEKLTNILELSSVTGHKDLRMLKRYYHPRPEDLARKLAG